MNQENRNDYFRALLRKWINDPNENVIESIAELAENHIDLRAALPRGLHDHPKISPLLTTEARFNSIKKRYENSPNEEYSKKLIELVSENPNLLSRLPLSLREHDTIKRPELERIATIIKCGRYKLSEIPESMRILPEIFPHLLPEDRLDVAMKLIWPDEIVDLDKIWFALPWKAKLMCIFRAAKESVNLFACVPSIRTEPNKLIQAALNILWAKFNPERRDKIFLKSHNLIQDCIVKQAWLSTDPIDITPLLPACCPGIVDHCEGRPWPTRENIWAVADQLDAEGIPPTLFAIREKLGGSNTDILEAMTDWHARKTQNTAQEKSSTVDKQEFRAFCPRVRGKCAIYNQDEQEDPSLLTTREKIWNATWAAADQLYAEGIDLTLSAVTNKLGVDRDVATLEVIVKAMTAWHARRNQTAVQTSCNNRASRVLFNRIKWQCSTLYHGWQHKPPPLSGARLYPDLGIDWSLWSLQELLAAAELKPNVEGLYNPIEYVNRLAGWINRLNEIRERIRCSACDEIMISNYAYAKKLAGYRATVFSCKNGSGHDQGVYINHCWGCDRQIIDSRESRIKIDNYYLCIRCGSGPKSINYRQGDICPMCGTILLAQSKATVLIKKGESERVIRCLECSHHFYTPPETKLTGDPDPKVRSQFLFDSFNKDFY